MMFPASLTRGASANIIIVVKAIPRSKALVKDSRYVY